MRTPKVNLLSGDKSRSAAERKNGRPAHFFLTWLGVFVVFLGSFAYGRMTFSGTTPLGISRLAEMPIIRGMSHLISAPDRSIDGEEEDRINILLLGMGGEGHDGAFLTDTIIIASIRPSDRQVAMLSVPRDLLVPMPNNSGWRKINFANAYGEMQSHGRGGELSRTVVEGLLGIDIPYYVRIDFNGFRDIVDSMGGVDVYVDRSFKDYTYPTEDYRVQTISFEKGWQHMDGTTSLMYARSRHGTNGEGSDFARSRRQQKVIAALKDKATASTIIKNPASVANALATLRANVTTNLQIGEILRLAKMAKDVDPSTVKHLVLSDAPNSPLVSGNYGGAYVLLPKNNDWSSIRTAASDLFELAEPSDLAAAEPKPENLGGGISSQPESGQTTKDLTAKVEIRNGTGKTGEARYVAERVAKSGYTIVKIGNADSFSYQDTVIYDLTQGAKPDALSSFADLVGAKRLVKGQPKTGASTSADFVLIIGSN